MKGLIIPCYFSSTSAYFATIISLAKKYPNVPIVAVFNCIDWGNGIKSPFSQATYDCITELTNVGVKVVGYVYTTTGDRIPSQINADVDLWYSYYPQISGIFFDEYTLSSVLGVSGYLSICSYARSKGAEIIAGNPGGYCSASYYENYPTTPDILTIWEDTNLPDPSTISGYPGTIERKGMIPYGQVSAHISDATYMSYLSVVSWVYFQSDTPPNAWDTLSTWFERQVVLLSGINPPVNYNYSTKIGDTIIKSYNTPTNTEQIRLGTSGAKVGIQIQDVTDDAAGSIRITTPFGIKSIKQL